MNSRINKSFRRDFDKLPADIQKRAKEAFKKFKLDPHSSGLNFKQVNTTVPLWSVRINDSYRAVGLRRPSDTIVWFFIGTHAEYDHLIYSLR